MTTDVHPLTLDDLAEITWAVQARLNGGESLHDALGVVLFNYGDRYAVAHCIGGEWTGEKRHLPPAIRPGMIPLCPQGHPLTQEPAKILALVPDDEQLHPPR